MAEPNPVVAVVLAGGDAPPAGVAAHVPPADLVIAADSGLGLAQQLGLSVDLVVGDLDSVHDADLDAAVAAGAAVERHPPEKDATDLELALDAACARGATQITIVGGHGGRLDHFVANVLLLASPHFRDVAIDGWVGAAHVVVVRNMTHLTGEAGSLVTLLAVGGAAEGVTTDGLRYPLQGETLAPGSTRGVSNELISTSAVVSLTSGALLAIQPHRSED